MSAKDLTIYFRAFEGEETTEAGPFKEGAYRCTVFVEVSEEGDDDSMESRSADEVAEETALTAASELARQKFAELAEDSAVITRLDESPDGVKAWLSK